MGYVMRLGLQSLSTIAILGILHIAVSLTASVFRPNDGRCKNTTASGSFLVFITMWELVNVPPRHCRVTKYSPLSRASCWVSSSNCGLVQINRTFPPLYTMWLKTLRASCGKQTINEYLCSQNFWWNFQSLGRVLRYSILCLSCTKALLWGYLLNA